MRKYLVFRHFVNGEGALDELFLGIENINAAHEISEQQGFEFNFGLKLTIDKNTSEHCAAPAREVMLGLPRDVWLLYDPEDRGPGTSYRQILFNPTFTSEPSIVASCDLDQFVVNEAGALEQIAELVQKVETDKTLYAAGSRDVPVVLATNKRNSDLRAIHELFHSLAIGSRSLKEPGIAPEGVTPAYAKIGECVSGFYVINAAHKRYPDLIGGVARASQVADLSGFATDSYVAMKAIQLGGFSRGYVRARENVFYETKDEDEERTSVENLVRGVNRELRKTDVGRLLFECVAYGRRADKLSEFYPREDVEMVRSWILE